MSTKDIQLIDKVGVPIARFADALDITRQAVSRGINNDADYFSASRLVLILKDFKEDDEFLYSTTLKAIRELYKDKSDEIAEALSSPSGRSVYENVMAEYWLICDDILEFINFQRTSANQLDIIINNINKNDGHLSIITSIRSEKNAKETYEKKFEVGIRLSVWPCESSVLSHMPIMLCRIDNKGELDLYACGVDGFVGLSKSDAMRVRKSITLIESGQLK